MTLAIDTSLGTSFALIDGSKVLATVNSPDSRRHVEALGQLMDAVAAHRSAITQVVVGMGPGAFTGLRVGIATGEAIATGLGVPCVRICSHDAAGNGTTAETVVTSDVRRGERAWSLYRDGVRVDGPNLAPADAVPVPEVAARIDLDSVDPVALAAAAEHGYPVEAALYLRPADAVVPGPPKTVSTTPRHSNEGAAR